MRSISLVAILACSLLGCADDEEPVAETDTTLPGEEASSSTDDLRMPTAPGEARQTSGREVPKSPLPPPPPRSPDSEIP